MSMKKNTTTIKSRIEGRYNTVGAGKGKNSKRNI